MSSIEPFEIPSIPPQRLASLKEKLQNVEYPNELEKNVGWKYGAPRRAVEPLVQAWLNDYNWEKARAEMNKWHHYRAEIQMVHGSDFGTMVGKWLAVKHPQQCKGFHTATSGCMPPIPTPGFLWSHPLKVAKFMASIALGMDTVYGRGSSKIKGRSFVDVENDPELGYCAIQSTRPYTLAYGLTDSPVGLLAWLLEKYHNWSYPENKDDSVVLPDTITTDEFLTQVTLFWLTNSISSSIRFYYETFNDAGVKAVFPLYVNIPSAVSCFPADLSKVPREWLEANFNLQQYNELDMFNPSIPQEARDFVDFVNKSPSPFHCTHGAAELLKQAGFTEIKERDNWNGAIERNGKYYFTRNGSSIVAFVVGGKYVPGNGSTIVGAHTDSPCLKVKPISKKEKSGYLEVGVQLYGGVIIATRIPNKYGFIDQARMDRDLGVAGCVMVEDNNGKYRHTVVKVDRPLLRIPTLAIHLDRNANDSFTFNKEVQLAPILATATKAELNKTESDEHIEAEEGHHPLLIRVLADEMGVKPSQIRDFELVLYDTQNIENDTNVRVTVCFDNDKIGSTTAHGADSNPLPTTLQRLANTELLSGAKVSPTAFEEAMHKSILISADMVHAIHPNYPENTKKTTDHTCTRVLLLRSTQTSLVLKELAKKHVIPIQEFVVRNDSPCGSTIGPMLSAKLGLRTVDVGNPQLSMHSIREVGGTDDVKHGIDLLQVFFEEFAELEARIVVD
ncbi:hypothetical protein BDB00DRAFT_790791 [Zychaea mexicana]|uniref:uncharacterized protein n=1 Tax=Zychaea mexicana TaxID=64656 RepID=UPI0022FE275C|nr:uncharacterized protein BDB00DRAFT_790791 [Zychaea mexicana]KAI9489860.1 hypothetical protein BDB00DRAFT_790791 [Zychaea mexicana]